MPLVNIYESVFFPFVNTYMIDYVCEKFYFILK